MKLLPLAIVLAVASPAGLAAQENDGTGLALLRDCEEGLRASGDFARARYCSGVVRGTARTLALLQQDGSVTEARACLPAGTPDARLVTIVLGYLSEHPDELHLPDVQLVLKAVEAAFPCR